MYALIALSDVVRSVPGSYHIPRKVNSPSAYDWIVHSAPPNSLVTFISMRAAEIVGDRALFPSLLSRPSSHTLVVLVSSRDGRGVPLHADLASAPLGLRSGLD